MTQPAAPTLDRRPRPQRLRATADFERVMRRGRRVRGSLLHLVHRSNGIDESRIGYSVGRRVGNAVVRNRVKRRLRELVAARHLIAGRDVVVLAQPAAAHASFDELANDLNAQFRQAELEAPAEERASDEATASEAVAPERSAAATSSAATASPLGLPARATLGLIRGYQRLISPSQPAACRYEPTCSAYAVTAVERYGAARGSWLAARRLLRCRPGAEGGYDPVPVRQRRDHDQEHDLEGSGGAS